MSVLIAGIGNIFFGDDAFGVEVVRRIERTGLPPGVRIADFGISGLHLAYELLDGYDTTILVDAAPRGGEPGTVYLIEADTPADSAADTGTPAGPVDAHGMRPEAVLRLVRQLGGQPGRVLVVGCEPARLAGIGLSPAATAAVPEAVELVTGLARDANRVPRAGSIRSEGVS